MSNNLRKPTNFNIPTGPPFDLLYSERIGIDLGIPLPTMLLDVSLC